MLYNAGTAIVTINDITSNGNTLTVDAGNSGAGQTTLNSFTGGGSLSLVDTQNVQINGQVSSWYCNYRRYWQYSYI